MSSLDTKSIGFIGTGVMGVSIVRHLLKKYQKVTIFNRSKEKAGPLLKEGATWAESPAALAKNCQLIFTMLGYPNDVESVYLEPSGLIQNSLANTILVDLTTSSPELAQRIAQAAQKKQLQTLDAPVSGGDVGAQKGTLTIMVGGHPQTYQEVLPYFQTFGTTIVHQGDHGAGQHTKACNQILIASNMIGICEAIQYAKTNGLNPERVLESVSGGSASSWSLLNLAPKMLNKDYQPGFYIHHFIKDLQLASDAALAKNLDLKNLNNALKKYKMLTDEQKKNCGTQAIFELFQ